jgi:hypothetical protein
MGAMADLRNDLVRPTWIWQTQAYVRRFHADAHFSAGDPGPADDVFLPADTLWDGGFYTQVVRAHGQTLATGVRFDFVTGDGQEYGGTPLAPVSRSQNEWRDDRWRLSGLLVWRPRREFRLRV